MDVAGVAVQVNESIATVGGSTKAETGIGVTLPAAVRITADAVTALAADQRGGTGGLVGRGDNSAEVTSAMVVEAGLGAGNAAAVGKRVSLLRVTASHRYTSSVYALAGAGGVIGGALTSATLTDSTTTLATIGAATPGKPLAVGTLMVSAEREQAFATQADSYYGGLVAGIGLPSAAFTTTATAETRVATAADIDASLLVTVGSGMANWLLNGLGRVFG